MLLPAILSAHAVLQCDRPLTLWGWDTPGASLRVDLAGRTASTTAAADGRWQVTLEPIPAGGPHTLTIRGATTVELPDILLGEVWFATGQSNMHFRLREASTAADDIPNAHHPDIRFCDVGQNIADHPQRTGLARWFALSPQTAPHVSAVAYYFARELHQTLNVPVGIVDASWGGSSIEAWLSPEAFDRYAALKPARLRAEQDCRDYPEHARLWRERVRHFQQCNARLIPVDHDHRALHAGWHLPAHSDADWTPVERPAVRHLGPAFHGDGILWYRRRLDLPDGWADRDLLLELGPLDTRDQTYVNGRPIGSTDRDQAQFWLKPRAYTIPAEIVQPGPLTIAIRALFQDCAGNAYGDGSRLQLRPAHAPEATPVPLLGQWRAKLERTLPDAPKPADLIEPWPWPPPQPAWGNHHPAGIYNGMVHPFFPLTLRGVLWYQGESNANRASEYAGLLNAFLADWRERSANPELALGIVQLANFGPLRDAPAPSNWAELREAQTQAFEANSHTGLVTAIDVGDPGDIHPRNKRSVGLRLACWALDTRYATPRDWRGPRFSRFESAPQGALSVYFDNVGDGLTTADQEPPREFTLCGPDQVFHRAQARIIAPNQVQVQADAVRQPVALRYAWADSPRVNLTASNGLPALPFRS